MKRTALFIVLMVTAYTGMACDVCQKNQPAPLRGITHGTGPQSQWDLPIVVAAGIIVALTLALALRIEPRIAERVARVVVMGGAVNRAGNASAAAEANTRNDPEAAQIVFDAPWPVTLVGLDVTQQTLFTDEQMAWLAALGGAQSTFLHAAHRYYLDAYRRNKALDGFHIHDASALLYLLAPNLFVTRPLHVEVERHSPIHFGMTVADWRYSPAQPPNVEVCVDVQAEPLMRALKKRLARLK